MKTVKGDMLGQERQTWKTDGQKKQRKKVKIRHLSEFKRKEKPRIKKEKQEILT